jgi:5-methylcytosine-specific restriction endonuclease McrA
MEADRSARPAEEVSAMTAVSLLNASYEPMGTVTFQHAVRMLFRQVATVEEAHDDKMIGPHPWPRVIRLVRYVAATWMYRPAAFSRAGVLKRDRHRCAYCGGHATTIDHLVPRSRGGTWSWLNTVAACSRCNHRKGNRTPREAGMRLTLEPTVPTRAQLAAAWLTETR